MGRETAVRIEFEQAVDSDGDWALAALALSGSFLQLNNPAAAIESVQRTWSLDIGRHDARSGLETLPVEPLDYDALERSFRAIQPVEFQSQIPTVVGIVQAHACVAEGIKCDKARATLRAVVDGDSGELYAHVWLARVELARGNPQAAVKLLDPALGQTDRQPFVMGLRGTAYAAMGDAERARVDFENGLRQLGDRTGLRVHYAQALLDLGDLDGAREQALLVLEQEPDVRARAVLVAVGEAAE
jgi:tetratricopeptide (TPR) repeat protein